MMKVSKLLLAGALAAGLSFAASSAGAAIDKITIDWSGDSTPEILTLNPTAGQMDGQGPAYVLYNLLSDSYGNNGIFFGDSSTGGWVGTGPISGGVVQQTHSDFWSSAFYSGSGLKATLKPGTYFSDTGGSSLTIAAVPEPATWAMLILGVAMLGFAARRRRESMVLAA